METKKLSIVDKAMQYAIKCHEETNHKYGNNLPYSFHLGMVYSIGKKFIHLVDEESEMDNVLAGCWTHDLIEDCRQTYNDVKENTNETIAELTYALTNEKGKDRKEKANDKYYAVIWHTPNATFLKLCDRIANIQYSKETGSRMFEMYCNENESFVKRVYYNDAMDEGGELFEIFNCLHQLCNVK